MRAADGVTFFATEKKTNYSPSSERSGVIKRRKSDGRRRSRRERGGEAGLGVGTSLINPAACLELMEEGERECVCRVAATASYFHSELTYTVRLVRASRLCICEGERQAAMTTTDYI